MKKCRNSSPAIRPSSNKLICHQIRNQKPQLPPSKQSRCLRNLRETQTDRRVDEQPLTRPRTRRRHHYIIEESSLTIIRISLSSGRNYWKVYSTYREI